MESKLSSASLLRDDHLEFFEDAWEKSEPKMLPQKKKGDFMVWFHGVYHARKCTVAYDSFWVAFTTIGSLQSWESKVTPPPQSYPPQEIASLIKGLLTIGFP